MKSSQSLVVRGVKEILPREVRVSTMIPNTKNEHFVVVSRIGGGSSEFGLRDSRFLIEVFSLNENDAELISEYLLLNLVTIREKVREVMWAKSDNNLARFETDLSGYTRFQFTATVNIKRESSDSLLELN